MLIELNSDFFDLGVLLNRLLNEKYDGKKIKFINLDFATYKTYELHPVLPKEEFYYRGGHLRYYGVFDKQQFEMLSKVEQNKYVWYRAYQYLCKSAKSIKNEKLLKASEYAYKRGIEIDMNPDYKVVETSVSYLGMQLEASIWINFKDDGMYSKLELEKNGVVVFEKNIDKARKGVEFFLEMYKKIEMEENDLVIKGHKDVEYLPLRIPLEKMVL